MSTESKRKRSRLHDLEVTRVDMVDRGANKKRYLVTKGSDESMDDNTGASDDQTTDDGNGSGGTGEGGGVEGSGGDTLDVAVQALDGLTDAVEELSSLDGDALRERATEVAGDLRAAAELLLDHTGGGNGDDDGSSGGSDSGDDLFAGIRSTLDRVTALLADRDTSGDDGGSDGDGKGSDADDSGGGGDSDPDLATQLGAFADKLDSIAGAVKKQGDRLARLEKRHGVPQSKPAGERTSTKKSDDEDGESWPFDLNAPQAGADS